MNLFLFFQGFNYAHLVTLIIFQSSRFFFFLILFLQIIIILFFPFHSLFIAEHLILCIVITLINQLALEKDLFAYLIYLICSILYMVHLAILHSYIPVIHPPGARAHHSRKFSIRLKHLRNPQDTDTVPSLKPFLTTSCSGQRGGTSPLVLTTSGGEALWRKDMKDKTFVTIVLRQEGIGHQNFRERY